MKIYYLLIITFLGGVFTSCKEDEIMFYDYESTGTQMFFEYAYLQTVNKRDISFAYDKITKTDSVVKVPVRFMGIPAEYDREFIYEIVDTSSTGKIGINYDIVKSVIPADEVSGFLNLRIYNTPELKDTILSVCVRLLPNKYFGTNYPKSLKKEDSDPLEFYINFDSNDEIPNLWRDCPTNARGIKYFELVFGDYSAVKFDFIVQTLGYDREDFIYDPEVETAQQAYNKLVPGTAAAQLGIIYGWCVVVNNALDIYEKINGERLIDENGEVVELALNNK